MTPTQSNDTTSREDELRADIERHLRHYKYYHANSPKGMSDKEANDFLVDYIKQYGIQERNRAIEDVKRAGYGYDDGTGFVLRISFAELTALKDKEKAL